MTLEQWAWYAYMVNQDEKEEYEHNISLIEYLASFWNAEAVKSIREMRDSSGNHNFMNDEDFEEQVLSRSFVDDPIIQSIKEKYKNTNLHDNDRSRDARSVRLPKNLAGLLNIAEES